MSLSTLAYIAIDLVALVLLVGVLYTRRHSRKDLLAAYVGVNIGVLAVTLLLSTASVGAGLGLGLFGVLSIIRLRSTELSQHEVAYFFAALALGLLGGITAAPLPMTAVLMGLVVASLWIADHPAIMRRNRHQIIMVDRAITDEDTLIAHLEQLLDAQVRSVEVQRLDLVDDTTLVDVRFRLPKSGRSRVSGSAVGTAAGVGTAGVAPDVAAPAYSGVAPAATTPHPSPAGHGADAFTAAPANTADYAFPPAVQPTSR
ncbi:DUF4956 domain-containing protein [Actinomyces qiguomingii]|uniref:DUF4956 domain-containing protein n=1 Tax=Actinomyces qiguomingii TaxID=2057800 RepID=UPI00157FB7C6|nr:DUF4956 domain-containing protein [Actinomyces qiguomingii]